PLVLLRPLAPELSPHPARRVVEQRVGDGGREQREQQRQDLPADDAAGGGAGEAAANAAREQERDHARHERQRGHEDGPEPVAVAVEHRVEPRRAGRAQVVDVAALALYVAELGCAMREAGWRSEPTWTALCDLPGCPRS